MDLGFDDEINPTCMDAEIELNLSIKEHLIDFLKCASRLRLLGTLVL